MSQFRLFGLLGAVAGVWVSGCVSNEATLGSQEQGAGLEQLSGTRNDALRAASDKQGVPLELLAVLGYQQSRLESGMTVPNEAASVSDDGSGPMADPTADLPPDPDSPDLHSVEHDGSPRIGILSLTEEQVRRAVELTGLSEDDIRNDLTANIHAAAALLRELAAAEPGVEPMSEDAFRLAATRFLGIDPLSEAGELSGQSMDALLKSGFELTTSDGERVSLRGSDPIGQTSAALAPGQYPAVQFIAASTANFSGRAGAPIQFIVMHDIEGTSAGAVAAFQNPRRQASAHYIISAANGRVIQTVPENANAWHAGNSFFNTRSIGIEQDGFADRPGGGGFYTPRLYDTSAALVCAIAKKYNIPVDRAHIFGHGNVPSRGAGGACSDAQANAGVCGGASHHHDPGRFYDWGGFMNRVASCAKGQSIGTAGLPGAIGAKYDSLGGEASFLGKSLGAEAKTPRLAGAFMHFAGGSIYWSPATGAWSIHGNIRAKYESVGWENSPLGFPISDESGCGDGVGRFNHFASGSIYWTPSLGAHVVRGAIRDRWAALGWEHVLGYPTSDETASADGIGAFSHFVNGSIYWTDKTGAHAVQGDIQGKYAALGWEKSFLGYPLTDESKTPDGLGRFNHFQNGSIYWLPSLGAHVLRGAIGAKWASLGFERSLLGYPSTDEVASDDKLGAHSEFQNGAIYWKDATGAHELHGALLAAYKAAGDLKSLLGYPISDVVPASGGFQVTFEHGSLTVDGGGKVTQVLR